jgi:hypothetical protein
VGDISNPGVNVANYRSGADWNFQDGFVTTVGSAGPLSDSFYRTADQGGNVWEWNETLFNGSDRGLRGGSFLNSADSMEWSNGGEFTPTRDREDFGFRMAAALELGDANLDGIVDGADYTAWADHFLQTSQTWENGDFSGDGLVDGADYTIWADHVAPAQLSLAAVPEPSTLALAAIGTLALAVTAARRRLT